MAANEHYFVEWKEQYVSKEKGNRIVHYFLKDNSGESILTVVGTERSARHMFYVVADEFLSIYGTENSVLVGFRWRSRREVVNWLTSMLSKKHLPGDYIVSLQDDPTFDVNAKKAHMPSYKAHLTKNSKSHHLDISWSGSPSVCGKKLKHYPAFCRNGISIAMQSFVFIMAEKKNPYIAYLEDIYEDRKSQKKVKVRWFHHNKEIKGNTSLQNLHPKEVFITSYVQVISAECVDGPAIVLSREHYEKCVEVFPHDLLDKVHFCSKQFKSNKVKPFRLTKLRRYFDQPIFSCFSPDFFEEKEFSSDDGVKVEANRKKSCIEHTKMTHEYSYHKRKSDTFLHSPIFALSEKVEFLCQDSGIRGCWFGCRVIEVSKRQMKILYDNLKDEEICSNLEEWVPIYRVAKTDKLGMRHPGRSTIRPAYHCDERKMSFEVGDAADAWWSDGWWEGIITCDNRNGSYQICLPGENLYINVELQNLRVSREWVGDQWVDVKSNPNILRTISATNTGTTITSTVSKDIKSSSSPTSCCKNATSHKLSTVDEEENDDELADMTLTNVPVKDQCDYDEQQLMMETEVKENYNEHVIEEENEENYNEHVIEEENEENTICDFTSANISNDNHLNHNGGDDIIDNGDGENNYAKRTNAEVECEAEMTEMLTGC